MVLLQVYYYYACVSYGWKGKSCSMCVCKYALFLWSTVNILFWLLTGWLPDRTFYDFRAFTFTNVYKTVDWRRILRLLNRERFGRVVVVDRSSWILLTSRGDQGKEHFRGWENGKGENEISEIGESREKTFAAAGIFLIFSYVLNVDMPEYLICIIEHSCPWSFKIQIPFYLQIMGRFEW